MPTQQMSIDSLLDDFALFDDWEDRYRYIIELGNRLEPLSEAEHSEINLVPGCVSQVWLVTEGEQNNLNFRGDSDAHIVRGLVAILLMLYSGKSAADVLQIDAKQAFEKLGLGEHLTPQRSNGFYSMVSRIRADAEAAMRD
jgi:cysteine desulfuration protein SufE